MDTLDVGEKVLVMLLLAEDDLTAVCDAIADTHAETESVSVLVDDTHADTVADSEPVPEFDTRGDGEDESDTVEHVEIEDDSVGEPDSVPDVVTVTDDDLVSHNVVEPVAVGDVERECELHADALIDVLAEVDLLRKGEGEKLGDAVGLTEAFELCDAAPDAVKLAVTLELRVELVECDADAVTDVERTGDKVGERVSVASDESEVVGERDKEPEMVPLPLAVPQMLALEVLVPDKDADVVAVDDMLGDRDGDSVDEKEDVALTEFVPDTVRVVETEAVPVDDCDVVRVPQGDAVNDPELDPDCDRDRVPHDDAVEESEAVPDELMDGDGDVVVDPVALTDPLTETVPDGLNEVVAVDEVDIVPEVVVDAEIVLDSDCETVPVPQVDALWVPDTVPHALTVVDGDGDVETVEPTDPL